MCAASGSSLDFYQPFFVMINLNSLNALMTCFVEVGKNIQGLDPLWRDAEMTSPE